MLGIVFQPLLLQLQRDHIARQPFPKQWLAIVKRAVVTELFLKIPKP